MSSPARPAVEGAAPAHPRHGLMRLAMLAVVTCWAANMVAGKEALESFGAVALAQLRVLGAGALYAIIFLLWPARPALRLSRREWIFMIVMALNGVTLNQLFFIGGLARSSVAHTGLIVALGPVMVLALAWAMRIEAMTSLKLIGMMISFAGVAVLTVVRGPLSSGSHAVGDLILLAGTAVFSYYTILMKEVADRFDALTLNMLTFVLGAALMLPFAAPAVAQIRWHGIRAAAFGGLAFMVILGTVAPYLLFSYALTGLSASRAAAFNYLQPIIASAFAVWLLAERIGLRTVAGGALILLGVYFTERERGEEPEETGRGLKLWM